MDKCQDAVAAWATKCHADEDATANRKLSCLLRSTRRIGQKTEAASAEECTYFEALMTVFYMYAIMLHEHIGMYYAFKNVCIHVLLNACLI